MKFEKIEKNHLPIVLSAILFAASFGFGIAVNSIALVLFLVTGLVFTIVDAIRKEMSFSWKRITYLSIVYFLLVVIRELSLDTEQGLEILRQNIAFLGIPLIFGFQYQRLRFYVKIILWAFLFGCLCNGYINIIYAIYRGILTYANGINFWYFTYEHLAQPFSFQPIYLAFFYVFALLILNHYSVLRKRRIFYYTSFAVLSISIILLAARNAILCLIVLVPAYLLISRRFNWKHIVATILIVGVSFIIAFQNPVVRNRIIKVNKEGNLFSGSSLRASIWQSAIRAGEANYLWGSGERRANELLVEQYKSKELLTPVKYKYHAHSLFFQTGIQYGLIGLIILSAMLLRQLLIAIKSKNYLFLFWMLLFILTSITESVFNRQWGILSFLFFTGIFLLSDAPGIKKEITSKVLD